MILIPRTMRELLFRLLGAGAADTGDVVGWQFQLHPALGWPVGLLVVAVTAALAVWGYLRPGVALAPARRRWLIALRAAALVGVGLLLLRPSFGLLVEGTVRQSLALLFDQSASMALRDPRTATADQVRAAIADGSVPAAGGVSRPAPPARRVQPTRLEGLQAVLTNRELALVERLARDFEIKAAGFAGELVGFSPGTATGAGTNRSSRAVSVASGFTGPALAGLLRADGRETAPGSALRELLERERGRALGGVVVFTDGIRNAGADPREAASLAREAGVPLHFVGLGTTAPRDLQVAELGAQEVAFVRDEVAVNVRLRARGLAGETVKLALTLAGTTVETREVKIEADGDVALELKVTPELTGDFELAVTAPARPDEILAENNRLSRRLRVVDDRIRVLFLEQSARWEFRYLQALLLRDRRVELKCVLYDGDPAIARDPGSPYLEAFPNRREDLFGYDLVIFGDVDPKHFTPAQLELISEFVARSGGSMLMLAGRRFSPWAYRDTALERLLPVEFDRVPGDTPATSVHDRPIRLALTAEGRSSPLLRLAEDPAENQRRWEALPPLFWVAPVRRAKPAAEVLVVENRGGDRGGAGVPVIAMQQYGVGRSMFLGTDNTWRWRRNEGEQYFVGFWGRVVQRLAIQHLLSGSRRTQIALDRSSILRGERLGVTARVFDHAFEPVADPLVTARVENEVRGTNAGVAAGTELILRAVPDQPGVFRGEIVGGAPGRYRVAVGGEAAAAADFTIEDRLVEAGETALQEGTLRELATATGGAFFREEDLYRLPDAVRGRTQKIRSRVVIEAWSSPLAFLGILALLAAEWILRKLWQLK